jgi:hypothetical protein
MGGFERYFGIKARNETLQTGKNGLTCISLDAIFQITDSQKQNFPWHRWATTTGGSEIDYR